MLVHRIFDANKKFFAIILCTLYFTVCTSCVLRKKEEQSADIESFRFSELGSMIKDFLGLTERPYKRTAAEINEIYRQSQKISSRAESLAGSQKGVEPVKNAYKGLTQNLDSAAGVQIEEDLSKNLEARDAVHDVAARAKMATYPELIQDTPQTALIESYAPRHKPLGLQTFGNLQEFELSKASDFIMSRTGSRILSGPKFNASVSKYSKLVRKVKYPGDAEPRNMEFLMYELTDPFAYADDFKKGRWNDYADQKSFDPYNMSGLKKMKMTLIVSDDHFAISFDGINSNLRDRFNKKILDTLVGDGVSGYVDNSSGMASIKGADKNVVVIKRSKNANGNYQAADSLMLDHIFAELGLK